MTGILRRLRRRFVAGNSLAGCFGALLFSLLLAPQVMAHPVSLTSVFVNAKEDKITAELNMLVEDLVLYYWLETDSDFRFPRETLKQQAIEHQEFLLKHLHLRDRDGRRFDGAVVDIDFSELPPEGVHIDDLMSHAIRYHFEFPFEEQPEFLTVSQDFGGEEPPVPAEMGVRFFHHGVHMEAVLLAHGSAHTINLDWEAGWEHAKDDLEGARERLRQRQEETLGITSYSRVYSYVYITDAEVRHELLIPLLTLDRWVPLPREDPATMSVEEQRAVRDDILGFLKKHSRIAIDGEGAAPVLDRMVFFGPDIRDFARLAPERPVSVYNARVGIILSYPREEPPNRMRFEWNFFEDRLPVLRPTIFAFEEKRRSPVLSRLEPSFEWVSSEERRPVELLALGSPPEVPMLRLPLWSLLGSGAGFLVGIAAIRAGSRRSGLVAGGLLLVALVAYPWTVSMVHPLKPLPELGEEEAGEIFQTLQSNIYRAFELPTEERIYDALDQSVAGPLLEEIYLQIRRKLTLEEQGGAVSRVTGIEFLDGQLATTRDASRTHQSFEYHSRWNVAGTVEHWGHVHTRTNQYEAVFRIEGLPSGWRITGFEPLREERVEMQIRLRQ